MITPITSISFLYMKKKKLIPPLEYTHTHTHTLTQTHKYKYKFTYNSCAAASWAISFGMQ